MKGWAFPPRMLAIRGERFARIFGKLVIRYTPTRIISEFRGERIVERYKVLGRDPDSVAIFSWENDPRLGEITHIHFDKKHYWVLTSAVPNVEFFRRISAATCDERLERSGDGIQRQHRKVPRAGRSTAGR